MLFPNRSTCDCFFFPACLTFANPCYMFLFLYAPASRHLHFFSSCLCLFVNFFVLMNKAKRHRFAPASEMQPNSLLLWEIWSIQIKIDIILSVVSAEEFHLYYSSEKFWITTCSIFFIVLFFVLVFCFFVGEFDFVLFWASKFGKCSTFLQQPVKIPFETGTWGFESSIHLYLNEPLL